MIDRHLLLEGARLVAMDLEADGNSPQEPVEVAVADMTADGHGPMQCWLIRAERPINPYAYRLHGLRNRDLADKPVFEDVAPAIAEALLGATIIGHGIPGDMTILARKIPALAGARTVDTLKFAKAVLPGLSSYRLHAIAEELSIDITPPPESRGHHSAPFDAALAAALFWHLVALPSAAPQRFLRDAGLLSAPTSRPAL